MSDLEAAARRLRDSVAALPEEHRAPWTARNKYVNVAGSGFPVADATLASFRPGEAPLVARHITTAASPPTVTLLADLLDEIASTAGDDAHRLNEIRANADALASAILHTDQHDGSAR